MNATINFVNKERLIACIEENIPLINENNKIENFEKKFNKIEPLKFALNSELSILNGITKKEEELMDNETKTAEKADTVEHAKTEITTEVLENNVPESYTNSYKEVFIKNGTDYGLTEEMLTPNIEINNKNVIIFHTHTCESYTPSELYNYEQTGTYRTTDLDYSVARVGTELEKQLKSYGFNVIHDTTYHDYPAYNGSYGRSQETVENILNENPGYDIIIDLHRDAIADYSYAPTVKIGDDYASQLMFVIGTDGGGLTHPNWNQNLKFAVKVQEKGNELYPGLFKPIILRNSRYNQQLSKGACIIEVGATGNTLEQSITSMKYLAKVLNEIVN